MTNQHGKVERANLHSARSSSYFLPTKKSFKHTFPPLEISVELGCSEKNLPLPTPFCDESRLPRKLPQIERSLKNVCLESGVIISFDTTFTVRLLNPPEILYKDKWSTCYVIYIILVVSLISPVHALGVRVISLWTCRLP